ncbi:MAG: polymer-forming cytoskeletal protein [Lachnospira sp.]
MGFFKDFKDDLSETVNSLNDENLEKELTDDAEGDVMVNTLDDPELAKMAADLQKEVEEESGKDDADLESVSEGIPASSDSEDNVSEEDNNGQETEEDNNVSEDYIADETAVITAGLSVTGNLDSIGSVDIFGTVTGNVSCKGKLTVSGSLAGDAKANEIFANNAQIDGNLEANGSVKIGQGTVVVGNIVATSAVIAGAVKGDIDVRGPVIVDSSAIIIGDIKSKTVQINNGATIDGRCSQCYAEINTEDIFNIKSKKKSK